MVKTNRSRRFVLRVFRNIGNYIDGSIPDRHRIGSVFWGTFTRELFKRIHRSYEVRSEGGTDDLGNKFKPLSPSTIAARPIGKGQLGTFGLTKKQSGTAFGKRTRGLLTPKENDLWKLVYARNVARLRLNVNERTARNVAAKKAWAAVKAIGAKTRKELLSKRNVLIMRVTDRIFNSLEPAGGTGYYRAKKDQLYEQVSGTITLGTLVEYAKHHNDTRPVIPDNIDPWITESFNIAMNEVNNHIVYNLL